MEYHSVTDVQEAERLSKVQRLNNAQFLRFDETKCSSARDAMFLRQVRAAAAERSNLFDKLMSEPEANRLFCDGAIWVERGRT